MISGEYYKLIYLIIVTVCTLSCYNRYKIAGSGNITDNSRHAFVLAVILSLFIGARPIYSGFYDTVGYAGYYNSIMGYSFEFSMDKQNILFDNILAWMASNGLSVNVWFTFCALVYFLCRYWSCKKMFPNNTWAAYLIFLAAFITFTSSVNGFKAGAASSLFCVALAYKDDKRWWMIPLFLALSYGFHHSMHVCIAAFIACYFYKNTKVYSVFWIFAFICAVAHVSYFQILFAGLTDEKGAGYLLADEDTGWHTGMRYDFVLYSAMPVFCGWYIKFKKKIDITGYDFILNLYLLLNGMWMLCMYANFTNRIAALSWFMYALVLAYPFLHGDQIFSFNKNKTFSTILILHLAFTLFMSFIYYA